MKIAKLAQLASILAPFVVGAGSGCDSSSSGDPIAGDEDDDDEDGDRPTHTPDPGRGSAPLGLAAAVPAKPVDPPLGIAECGDGQVGGDEQCDDGEANGATRECTDACVFNSCELDAAGNCSGPAHPDFDLYPCADVPGTKEGCDLDYATP